MPDSLSGSIQAEVGARARKRITRRLMPYLLLLYFIAFIDRTNVSVAALQMKVDLGFSDAIIGAGAGVFFIGYFLLESPGTLIVENWSARKWIARIMISWGIVASVMGLIGTHWLSFMSEKHQFYSLRFILGLAEAGFFPGRHILAPVSFPQWGAPLHRHPGPPSFFASPPQNPNPPPKSGGLDKPSHSSRRFCGPPCRS